MCRINFYQRVFNILFARSSILFNFVFLFGVGVVVHNPMFEIAESKKLDWVSSFKFFDFIHSYDRFCVRFL